MRVRVCARKNSSVWFNEYSIATERNYWKLPHLRNADVCSQWITFLMVLSLGVKGKIAVVREGCAQPGRIVALPVMRFENNRLNLWSCFSREINR